MTIIDNQMLWRQFAVAIDSLGAALRSCPSAQLHLFLGQQVTS